MAIKISGTTVVDDSRNILNIETISAANTVTATTFIGDGSQLTGVEAGLTPAQAFTKIIIFG